MAATPAVTPKTHHLMCRIATGQYTGNGAISYAITGIGFRPKVVMIWQYKTSEAAVMYYLKTDTMAAGLCNMWYAAACSGGLPDRVISLDADGFTVDDRGTDADPNKSGQVYDFVCLG